MTKVPLLSVIVPVYRVERYLAECLDSVLAPGVEAARSGIEVIAVEDASDDGCAAILRRYAARDPRLTVVRHERNLGLAAARNTGLARARGDYVWFVDGDDWLLPGTLAAVCDRLTATRPDVLVTALTRFYWDGRVRHESLARIGGDRPPPEVFRLAEQPGLLSVLHIACNKVIRRDFLAMIGLTFAPGWYEDVSFSFPMLLCADRIGLLDRSCYAYRQRRDGAITHTVSPRHFEVFPHWDRVFEFIAARPQLPAELRLLVFRRMIWHLFQVLDHTSRVPAGQRRAFFRELSRRYRRWAPVAGHRPAPGGAGRRDRLIARDAYRLHESLRAARRLRAALRGRLRPFRAALRGRLRPFREALRRRLRPGPPRPAPSAAPAPVVSAAPAPVVSVAPAGRTSAQVSAALAAPPSDHAPAPAPAAAARTGAGAPDAPA